MAIASPHEIDYENFVFDGCLRKIINHSHFESNKVPQLATAWLVEFPPKKSSLFLKFVKSEVNGKDPIQFQYLKRIKKMFKGDEPVLIAIACSTELVQDEESLVTILARYDLHISDGVLLSNAELPNNYPYSKDISDHWSVKFWPVIWKGNPVIQELNQIRISVETERKYLKEITKISQNVQKNELPIVTMFVNPILDEVVIVQCDCRDSKTPITHSIIDCIQQIAENELAKREALAHDNTDQNYLCLNYHVYTTHEPCSMCVMALIHSRIGKLTYIKSSPMTGSVEETSGLRFGAERFSGLNWKFDSWKWCGNDLHVPDVEASVFI